MLANATLELAPRRRHRPDRVERAGRACGASPPTASRLLRGWPLWITVGLAQATTFAQAGTGAWLMARDDIDPPQLHALYGFSAIIAVGILYSYRTSSFMKGKKYLLYSVGSLFIMGLGLRELLALS